ncbi:MAG: FkbM family methyltransferase [Verrucomicrobiae bacterium]|nr:FkbM family methyltransferase [Verrucomicrobiae bacterium]
MKPWLKRLVSLLPESMQQALRRSHYRRKLQLARLTDEPDLAAIALLTKPGDTVLDIGANFGLFTRFLSESVGNEGTVYSFEPTGDMFTVLENNCRSLGLKNAKPFRTALSDHSGISEMLIPVREDGTLNHYEASLEPVQSAASGGKTVRVETSTLDEFCSHHGVDRVDFIKCDVEGHELEVLEGARGTLLHHRPTMLIEVNAPLDAGGHGSHVLEKVRELGYDIHTVKGNELRPWQPGEVCVNYVLRPH